MLKHVARSRFHIHAGRLLALLAFLLLLGSPLGAQTAGSEAGTLRGQVLDTSGAPISSATVRVVPDGPGALSDAAGRFTVRDVPAGAVQLRVERLGFRSTEFSVDAATAGALEIVLESSPIAVEGVVTTATPTGSGASYQAVQAFNTEQLRRLSGTSLGEMLDGQPGLSSRSFGSATARPIIRGFDGERLLVLENGERMGHIQETAPDHAITLDPMARDRLEVVRGPASLLYGSSALGGVVNILNRDAPDTWAPGLQGGVSMQGASMNEMRAGSGRVIHGWDRIGVSGRFTYREAGDGRTPTEIIPNSQTQTFSTAFGVGMNTDRFQGGWSVSYHDNDYGVPEFGVETEEGEFVEAQPDMEVRIDRINTQARGTWELDRWVEAIDFRTSFSRSLQEEGEPGVPAEELELEIDTRFSSSTVMLRHNPVAFLDEGVLGLNFLRKDQGVEGLEAYFPGETLTSLAVFTFQEIPLGARSRLQVGGRLEQEWLETRTNQFFGDADMRQDNELQVSWSMGVNTQPIPGLEIGTQLARAHRNPTVLERYANGWHAGATRVELGATREPGDPRLESEVGHGLDLFTRFGTERFRIEVAGFYNRIDNYVALETMPADCGDIEYRVRADREFPACVRFFSADAEMLGGEATLDVLLTDDLRARVVSDFVRGTRRDGDQDPLPFIPPFRTSLELEREWGRASLGGTFRWVNSQTRVPADELPTDSYTLMGLNGTWAVDPQGQHRISFTVDNLLDSSYQDHLPVVRRFPAPVSPDNPARFDMPGRNITVSYRWMF
ncbi:MAG: TonB-dependent receptor [Gemmatimonadales bacterium]|nr:MAG: TonB-dependent receptor [Gemmatimonadales bacterium]